MATIEDRCLGPLVQERERFAKVAMLARSGRLHRAALEDLIRQAERLNDVGDRASVLRFALRVARVSENSLPEAESALGALYDEVAHDSKHPAQRLCLLTWARRYGRIVELAPAENALLAELRRVASAGGQLSILAMADVRCILNADTGSLLLKLENRWEEIPRPGQKDAGLPAALAGDVEGEFSISGTSWRIAARTRTGKHPPSRNDDGALVLKLQDGRVLAAVADGTGDSEFGYLASRLALHGLGEALASGASLADAVEWSSACVRADNLARRLDGMTTLVACVFRNHQVELVSVGDPLYAIKSANGGIIISPTVHEERSALGGEPLGRTITSSGRLVNSLLYSANVQIIAQSDVCGFVLGSDGLLVGQSDWSEAWLSETLRDAMSPEEIAERLVTRAEIAIGSGAKPDNVTAIVARHAGSDDASAIRSSDTMPRVTKLPVANLGTEGRNPRTMNFDLLETFSLCQRINDEDAEVAPAVRSVLVDVARAVDLIVDRLSRGGRLVYAGAGTSGRICVLDAASCNSTFGISYDRVWALLAGKGNRGNSSLSAEDDTRAAEGDVEDSGVGVGDVLVGVSASGRTPYVLSALTTARSHGVATIAVTANTGSPIVEAADIAIIPATGAEALTGSTRLKAGTAQKLVLNTISTAVMVRLGKTYSNLMVDMLPQTEKLRRRAIDIVAMATGCEHNLAAQAIQDCGDAKTAILHVLSKADPAGCAAALVKSGGVLRLAIEELTREEARSIETGKAPG